MKETLADLAIASSELNKATDELNDLLEQFEDKLQRMGVGIAWWSALLMLPEDTEEVDRGKTTMCHRGWRLGYGKLDRWRVIVQEACWEVKPGEYSDIKYGRHLWAREPIPALQAPRQVRVEVALNLEDLARVLARQVRSYTNHIVEAKKFVEGQ